jgi:pimeloyl-ACP methyl ester carboxylesterase
MASETSFRTTDGVRISYEECGQGRPMVFVHGWAATREFWRNQITGLSGEFRVIAPDLRGHGSSAMDIGLDYTIERMSRDLRELIQGLDLRDYLLVGHSLGGALAVRCCEPQGGCGGLVLTGVSSRTPGRLSVLLMSVLLKSRGLAERVVTPRMFRPHVEAELVDFVKGQSARSPVDVLVSVMRQIAGTEMVPHPEEAEVPTLVIAGDSDRIVAPEKQRLLADRMGAKFVMVRDAGHNLMLERPARFNQILKDFASLDDAGP